jgi:hypothetical protein
MQAGVSRKLLDLLEPSKRFVGARPGGEPIACYEPAVRRRLPPDAGSSDEPTVMRQPTRASEFAQPSPRRPTLGKRFHMTFPRERLLRHS